MSGRKYLLDSNFIINLINGRVTVSLTPHECAVSVITVMEVLGFQFTDPDSENLTRKFLSLFQTLYVDERCTEEVIILRKSRKIKLPDAIIASTAVIHDLILFTNDQHFCSIEGLQMKSFLLEQSR